MQAECLKLSWLGAHLHLSASILAQLAACMLEMFVAWEKQEVEGHL